MTKNRLLRILAPKKMMLLMCLIIFRAKKGPRIMQLRIKKTYFRKSPIFPKSRVSTKMWMFRDLDFPSILKKSCLYPKIRSVVNLQISWQIFKKQRSIWLQLWTKIRKNRKVGKSVNIRLIATRAENPPTISRSPKWRCDQPFLQKNSKKSKNTQQCKTL